MRRSLLTLALLAATACSPLGTSGGGQPGSPRAGTSMPPGASSTRIAAIATVIARTSNPDDGFVTFEDTSDKDGIGRYVQMAGCGSNFCHVEALCDKPPITCDRIGPKLEALGFQHDAHNPTVYFSDRAGSPQDLAVLTETIYLTVLGASADYRLSWRSSHQTTPLPV